MPQRTYRAIVELDVDFRIRAYSPAHAQQIVQKEIEKHPILSVGVLNGEVYEWRLPKPFPTNDED